MQLFSERKCIRAIGFFITIIFSSIYFQSIAIADDNIKVSAPINTDSAGSGGVVAIKSVVRVVCPKNDSQGTGFLHKIGRIITAEHVISKCKDVIVIASDGKEIKVLNIEKDANVDLAILTLESKLIAQSFPIGSMKPLSIGLQVSTWGFPGGYSGFAPLLSAGYIAGVEYYKTANDNIIRKLVVNSAFNGGNSGGPLLNIETGEVIGVVSSKLAPIPKNIKGAMEALSKNPSGVIYTAKYPDGKTVRFSEGQVIALVLEYLRSQVQLVVGMAVTMEDLNAFLQSNGIEP